jgi:hypothetical protein
MSGDPIITELAALPLRTRRPLSPVTQWVETNFADIHAMRARASWKEIAAVCRRHGIVDWRGNPVTVYKLVNIYSRVKRARKL